MAHFAAARLIRERKARELTVFLDKSALGCTADERAVMRNLSVHAGRSSGSQRLTYRFQQ